MNPHGRQTRPIPRGPRRGRVVGAVIAWWGRVSADQRPPPVPEPVPGAPPAAPVMSQMGRPPDHPATVHGPTPRPQHPRDPPGQHHASRNTHRPRLHHGRRSTEQPIKINPHRQVKERLRDRTGTPHHTPLPEPQTRTDPGKKGKDRQPRSTTPTAASTTTSVDAAELTGRATATAHRPAPLRVA